MKKNKKLKKKVKKNIKEIEDDDKTSDDHEMLIIKKLKRTRKNVLTQKLKEKWSKVKEKDWSFKKKWFKNEQLIQIINIIFTKFNEMKEESFFDY